jgi:hypothetical protein
MTSRRRLGSAKQRTLFSLLGKIRPSMSPATKNGANSPAGNASPYSGSSKRRLYCGFQVVVVMKSITSA